MAQSDELSGSDLDTPWTPGGDYVEGSGGVGDGEAIMSRDERIRRAAYARYEQRGREPGHEVEDWLGAEAEVGAESDVGLDP